MKEKKISYLHIVPFDYGYSFFDYLEMNNVKNLELTEQFIEEMKKAYSQNDAFKETFVVRNKKANMFESVDAIVQNEVFHIALTENLYVFVLLNGTGCFLILDDGEENPDEDRYIEISKINAYKRKVQDAILEGDKVLLSETRKEILSFLKKSRDILSTLSKKCKVKKERKCSGSEQYKYNGLSYVLTIYFVEENYLTDKQEKYLLYAPFSGYNKMAGSEEAKEIKEFLPEKTYECNGNHVKFLFSWSAVLAKFKKIPDSFDEMFKNIELRFLIKQEIYVQSRWFLADNALDNAAYGYSDKFDGLQKIFGLLEYDAAKLENMLSANMSTEEKNILQKIIQTSEVKELYSSAQQQISIQSRIKTAYEEKLKKRRLLLASLFMAIFTASSLYKSVNDILEGTAENPWLLISMLMIAIATVVFDYYYK